MAVIAAAALAAPARAAPPAATGGTAQASSGAGAGVATARAARGGLLWATVNVCDTTRAPNAMGVRASMPGNGLRQRMYMRFTAQSWNAARRAWTKVAGAGVSPWLYAGSARYRTRRAGWTFRFKAPRLGSHFLLRARVDFRWKAKRKVKGTRSKRRRRRTRWVVAKRRSAITKADLLGVDLGDPPGTSKAGCLIL